MRPLAELADRAEGSPALRETRHALADGARWGWAVALVAAVAVWVSRGLPSPRTAAAALLLAPVGVLLAWSRTWRRFGRAAGPDSAADRRDAAAASARRWATGYAVAAVAIPAGYLVTARPLLGVLVVLVVLAALAELAILTMPMRARARLLRRLRLGAAAVARTDDVRVGRALWSRTVLDRVHVTYPAEWGVQSEQRRDDLVERLMWEVCGPPPTTPAAATRAVRPDYAARFEHDHYRVVLERVPRLPRWVAARDWGQPRGALVLGQTHAEAADRVGDGVPLALHRPRAHMLITGGTQYGKSSSTRAWVVDGLTHGVWPGGVWIADGKGSGGMAPLIGRRGVHLVGHRPEEWGHVLDAAAAEVAGRYAEMLDWRAGRLAERPRHPRALLVLDEIQQILMARPDLARTLDTLARQALESGVILWVITQRPDARDAIPGAIRDQLLHRAAFGPLSSAGAKMTFDISGEWQRAMGVAPVPGRALMWIDGTWRTVQAPWLPIPADVPAVERLYPRRASATAPPRPRPAPSSPAGTSAPESAGDGAAAGADPDAYDPARVRRRRRSGDGA
ncbi:hypothetical protein AB0C74_39605 [Spirillospora sp. NPDC048832]